MKKRFFLLIFFSAKIYCWDNHTRITNLALQAEESIRNISFEFSSIEKSLASMNQVVSRRSEKKSSGSLTCPLPSQAREEFAKNLQINSEKIVWDLEQKNYSALEIISRASSEPDDGMDQNLVLAPYQGMMGGYHGLASQGVRHMFYEKFDISNLDATFHIPFLQMGFAPERAEIFFDCAVIASAAKEKFWAYRFLGWGLHYFQDIGQPYHAKQFASFQILPIWELLSNGFAAFVSETTRIVSNYHLSFEAWVESRLAASDQSLTFAFEVPQPEESLRKLLHSEQEVEVSVSVKSLAKASAGYANDIVDAQKNLFGEQLNSRELHWSDDSSQLTKDLKLNFTSVETNQEPAVLSERKKLSTITFSALSNVGIATRWYFEKFLKTQDSF